MNIGFLGYGTIAQLIHHSLIEHEGEKRTFSFIGAFDPFITSDDKESKTFEIRFFENFQDLLKNGVDLLIEAASQGAAKELIPLALEKGVNVISMSVGAFLDQDFFRRIQQICSEEIGGKLFIPSGALPSVDVIKAASVGEIYSIELRTTKPPKALSGAPGFKEWEEKIDSICEVTEIFTGSAEDAIHLFPKNINISSTLSLVGLGAGKTKVTVAVDPTLTRNVHELFVEGEFGELYSRVACTPSSNPKTSMIAPLSAVSLVLQLGEKIRIGS